MSAAIPCHVMAGFHRLAQALLAGLSILAALPATATGHDVRTSGTSTERTSVMTDINRSGLVVGYTSENNTGASTAFQLIGGARVEVTGPDGAVSTDLVGITDSGVMLGNFATTFENDGNGNFFPGSTRIFSLSGGVYSELTIPGLASPILSSVSANGRWLVGSSGGDGQSPIRGFAFDTQGGTLTQFGIGNGNTTASIAAGVNNLGVVVGYDRVFNPSVGTTGSGWKVDLATGERTEFQVAGSLRNGPRDITDAGVISGYYFTSLRPALAQGFTGLNSDFTLFDVPGASQTFVLGANDLGALVGQYLDADGNAGAFVAVPVPEPATTALMLAGLAGIAGAARRRQRAADTACAAG